MHGTAIQDNPRSHLYVCVSNVNRDATHKLCAHIIRHFTFRKMFIFELIVFSVTQWEASGSAHAADPLASQCDDHVASCVVATIQGRAQARSTIK